MSGTEFGYTLGTPVGLLVMNEDQRPGDYKEMSEIPRPGHADFTYQLKYGTRASSGGGRSSARETIGRVAAGAIAEKWLHETYGTEISCWVSSVGPIEMPASAIPLSAGSRGWTRAEVDEIGCLRMLRDPKYWRAVTDADELDINERKKLQTKLELDAETAFLAALPVGADGHDELATKPSYQDWQGNVYNFDGVPVLLVPLSHLASLLHPTPPPPPPDPTTQNKPNPTTTIAHTTPAANAERSQRMADGRALAIALPSPTDREQDGHSHTAGSSILRSYFHTPPTPSPYMCHRAGQD